MSPKHFPNEEIEELGLMTTPDPDAGVPALEMNEAGDMLPGTLTVLNCTVCSCDFDIEKEGGVEGLIGILPVRFCPTCRVGILDFAEQQLYGIDCPHCGKYIGDET